MILKRRTVNMLIGSSCSILQANVSEKSCIYALSNCQAESEISICFRLHGRSSIFFPMHSCSGTDTLYLLTNSHNCGSLIFYAYLFFFCKEIRFQTYKMPPPSLQNTYNTVLKESKKKGLLKTLNFVFDLIKFSKI